MNEKMEGKKTRKVATYVNETPGKVARYYYIFTSSVTLKTIIMTLLCS